MITGVIMLCNYGHGGDELRGRKERKRFLEVVTAVMVVYNHGYGRDGGA